MDIYSGCWGELRREFERMGGGGGGKVVRGNHVCEGGKREGRERVS